VARPSVCKAPRRPTGLRRIFAFLIRKPAHDQDFGYNCPGWEGGFLSHHHFRRWILVLRRPSGRIFHGARRRNNANRQRHQALQQYADAAIILEVPVGTFAPGWFGRDRRYSRSSRRSAHRGRLGTGPDSVGQPSALVCSSIALRQGDGVSGAPFEIRAKLGIVVLSGSFRSTAPPVSRTGPRAESQPHVFLTMPTDLFLTAEEVSERYRGRDHPRHIAELAAMKSDHLSEGRPELSSILWPNWKAWTARIL